MRSSLTLTLATATVVALACFSGVAAAKPGNPHGGPGGGGIAKGRPISGRSVLTVPVDSTDDAVGVVDVKGFPAHGKNAARTWFRLKLERLDANASYSLWMNDPASLTQPNLTRVPDVTLTMNDDGALNHRIDTKHGGAMPFGATLEQLAGTAVEIRDDAGVVAVLTGNVPTAD